MSSAKKPIIYVIVGPTAAGKSDLAVKLAKKYNGEVVSADSRQIYKGLNIATGKITKKEMGGIPHHMLNIINPKHQYTVSDYKKTAEKILEDIITRGKTPIICGGTGFYISALLGEINFPDVPPNKKLRKQLLGCPVPKLLEMLKKIDPERAKTIDAKNPVRLIRAIEIAQATKSTNLPNLAVSPPSLGKSNIIKIGLDFSDTELKKRIYKRLISRMKKGMIAEAKKLHKNGLSFRRMRELGLEYRYLAEYLNNKISKQELIEKIEIENWHYAKRQRTWFKRDKTINWLRKI